MRRIINTDVIIKFYSEAQVSWTNSSNLPTKQDSHPSLPDNVVLTLTMGNETILLNLTKKQNDDFEEIPVIEGSNGTVRTWHHSRNEVRFVLLLACYYSSFFAFIVEHNQQHKMYY